MASIDVLCMACDGPDCNHRPVMLKRRAPGDDDVVIAMKYCGICHTDLHGAKGDLDGLVGRDHYPNVAGHELSGVCTAVGKNVTKFKVGDYVGVGCMVDSCGTCKSCKAGTEQLCTKQTGTYNARDNGSGRSSAFPPKSHTLGGYTTTFVVYHKFAILIPQTYPLEMAGPVMCAGVTLYSPLREYGAKEGTKVAIVGLGGLGSIGVQIARALGCEVTAISSTNKKEELAKSLGAGAYLVSSDFKAMGEAKGKFDLVLNTIPSEHNYSVYTPLCTGKGKHVVLSVPTLRLCSADVAQACRQLCSDNALNGMIRPSRWNAKTGKRSTSAWSRWDAEGVRRRTRRN